MTSANTKYHSLAKNGSENVNGNGTQIETLEMIPCRGADNLDIQSIGNTNSNEVEVEVRVREAKNSKTLVSDTLRQYLSFTIKGCIHLSRQGSGTD